MTDITPITDEEIARIERVKYRERIEYRRGDLLHREDGPAVEWADGSREWWVNGEPHREDGPAIDWSNGMRVWWWHGERLSGPEELAVKVASKGGGDE